jgi:hypothetical protein
MRGVACLAITLACGAAVSGCGGGSKPPLTGPATLVPVNAPLYGETLLKLEGDQHDAVESMLGRALGTSRPGPKLERLLDDAINGETPGFTYTGDIKPWLGRRAGFFLSRFEGDGDGAAIVETTDTNAALAAIEKGVKAEKLSASDKEYKGVRYKLDSEGDANGIVGTYLVSGTETGFKAVVDTRGHDSLAGSSRFADAMGSLPDDRLFSGYLDPDLLLDQLVREGQVSRGDAITARRFLGNTIESPVLSSNAVRSDALITDLSLVPPSPASRLGLRGSALGELPADAWFAFGLRNVGERVKRAIEQSDALGAAVAQLQEQIPVPVDFNRDLLSWIGDASFFVEGLSKRTFEMALVLGSTDAEASTNAIHSFFGPITPKLRLRGGGEGLTIPPSPELPGRPIHIAQRESKVVAAIGDRAGAQAFAPSKKLADDPNFQQADVALGSFSAVAYVALQPALRFAEQFGDKTDPDYGDYLKAKPYLKRLGYAAVGTHASGDRDVFRFVVGLSQ